MPHTSPTITRVQNQVINSQNTLSRQSTQINRMKRSRNKDTTKVVAAALLELRKMGQKSDRMARKLHKKILAYNKLKSKYQRTKEKVTRKKEELIKANQELEKIKPIDCSDDPMELVKKLKSLPGSWEQEGSIDSTAEIFVSFTSNKTKMTDFLSSAFDFTIDHLNDTVKGLLYFNLSRDICDAAECELHRSAIIHEMIFHIINNSGYKTSDDLGKIDGPPQLILNNKGLSIYPSTPIQLSIAPSTTQQIIFKTPCSWALTPNRLNYPKGIDPTNAKQIINTLKPNELIHLMNLIRHPFLEKNDQLKEAFRCQTSNKKSKRRVAKAYDLINTMGRAIINTYPNLMREKFMLHFTNIVI